MASTALIRSAYFGNGMLEYLHGTAYIVWYVQVVWDLIHVGARNNALAMLVDKSQRVDSLLRTM